MAEVAPLILEEFYNFRHKTLSYVPLRNRVAANMVGSLTEFEILLFGPCRDLIY